MKHVMRHYKTIAVIAALVALVGCGANPTPQTDPTRNLSPEGRLAYQSMKVGKALDVLRDVAAEAEKQTPKLLSPKAALKVLAYHKQVVTTMAAAPGGWKAIALTGLDQLKQDLTAAEWAQVAPFATLLRTLLDEFIPATVRVLQEGGA